MKPLFVKSIFQRKKRCKIRSIVLLNLVLECKNGIWKSNSIFSLRFDFELVLFFLSLQYKTSRDKGVVIASRALITLFRIENPSMLLRKDRGRPLLKAREARREFGDTQPARGIPGAETLFSMKAKEREVRNAQRRNMDSMDSSSGQLHLFHPNHCTFGPTRRLTANQEDSSKTYFVITTQFTWNRMASN